MKWHLCNPLGVSVRTCEASVVQEARFRLAPIPRGWFVASDADYRLGWRVAPERLPVKKTTGAKARVSSPEVFGMKAKRAANAKKVREQMTPEEWAALVEARRLASLKGVQRKDETDPEWRQCKAAKVASAMRRVKRKQRPDYRAAVLRGIEHRRAKRLQLEMSL